MPSGADSSSMKKSVKTQQPGKKSKMKVEFKPEVDTRPRNPPTTQSDTHGMLSGSHWSVLLILIGACGYVAYNFDHSLPVVPDDIPIDQFSAHRAREYLDGIVSGGPRVTGSKSLEEKTIPYILKVLSNLKKSASSHVRLEYMVQRPDGCMHDLNYGQQAIECYKNVTNVVVRVGAHRSDKQWADRSVLVNCHTDSEPESPGASDDGISCAIMLEFISLLSHGPPTQHDVIFLFNGGEEVALMASHGFITQHPWRHSVRAFINLEAGGASGRELLFQSGPGNSWLLSAYLRSAPYVHCNVLNQEMFQSGIIPSDTDFRIFRDYGRIPGLDIAFVKNGYVYHTEFDDVQFVELGAIQRAGENAFVTLTHLLNSDALANPEEIENSPSSVVYFDYLGVFAVHLPTNLYAIVCSLMLATCISLTGFALRTGVLDINSLIICLFCLVTLIFVSLVYVILIASLALMLNLHLVWYASPFILVFLYGVPGFGAAVYTLNALDEFLFGARSSRQEKCTKIELHYFVTFNVVIALLLCVTLFYQIASGYFFAFLIVCALHRTAMLNLAGVADRPAFVYYLHLVSYIPYIVYVVYLLSSGTEIFAPIAGRMGTQVNSEVLLGLFTYAQILLIYLALGSILTMVADLKRELTMLVALPIVVFVGCIIMQWSPYFYAPERPMLKRLLVQHATRNIYDDAGSNLHSDNGIFVTAMDRRRLDDVPSGLLDGEQPRCFTDSVTCDLPYYKIKKNIFPEHTRWVSKDVGPQISDPLQFSFVKKSDDGRSKSFDLVIKGSNHIALDINLQNGTVLTGTSLVELDKPSSRKLVRAFLVSGSRQQTWKFSISVENAHQPPVLTVGVGSHHFDGRHGITDELLKLREAVAIRREASIKNKSLWPWRMTLKMWTSEYILRTLN